MDGNVIMLIVGVLLFAGIVIGFYTYRGSAIHAHPAKSGNAPPGAREPSARGGKGRTPDDPYEDDAETGAFESHGKR
jgi:hypothetical protein